MTTTKLQISDSQLKNFQRCPRRWAYQKLLKLDPDENKWNLTFGCGMHKGIEHLHKGDTVAGAKAAAMGEIAKMPHHDERNMPEMLDAMVDGYSTFFFPTYQQYWTTTAVEEYYTMEIGTGVVCRGYRDLKCVMTENPGCKAVKDFKTTGMSGGGDLGATVDKNHQLALYCISEYEATGEWPAVTGLVFLQKPRSKSINTVLQQLRTNSALYFEVTTQVDQAFAAWAYSVKEQVGVYGNLMLAYTQAYEGQGSRAIDFIPANLNNCKMYGSMCGFCEGCHSGQPVHRRMADYGGAP